MSHMRTHKLESTCGQAVLTETDQLLPFLRRASAITLRLSGTGVLRRAQLQTHHPRDSIEQVAASIVGGAEKSSLSRTGVFKEHLLQIISVTTQVAISRRVNT